MKPVKTEIPIVVEIDQNRTLLYTLKSFPGGEIINPFDQSNILASIDSLVRQSRQRVSLEDISPALDKAFDFVQSSDSAVELGSNQYHVGISITSPESPISRKSHISYLIVSP